jgi:hypothetical protein
VITNRVANDLRLNYSSNDGATQQGSDAFGGAAPVDLAQLGGLSPGSLTAFLLLSGPYGVSVGTGKGAASQRQWNLVDSVSVTAGSHRFKLGVDYRRLTPTIKPENQFGEWIYLSQTDLQANNALAQSGGFLSVYPLYTNFALFAQDEWRLSARLSLSLGLRWDVNPAPGVTRGFNAYTLQGSDPNTVTLAPYGTPLWHTTWFNIAPRLGMAYLLRHTPGSETVLRIGGGVFFDTGQQMGSINGFVSPGAVTRSSLTSVAFPVLPAIPPFENPPLPPYDSGANVYDFAPHLQMPYTLQWNASLQQALGTGQSLTVSYVGSHANKLLQSNFIQPTSNPNLSFYTLIQNGLTSDYHALQIQYQRRLSAGLTALASYTLSHCLDYGSENFNFGYQRGNCDFDVRHNFSAAFSYDVPSFAHGRILGAVLNHWGLDDRILARTAFPVTLTGNQLLEPNGKTYDAGLDLVPGQPIYAYGANCTSIFQAIGSLSSGQGCPGGRGINPNAFVNVSTGLGDAPRNFARGFGAWQMNMAVRREFPIHESLKLQFRAEAFNVFNHPNFGMIGSGFGASNFGLATATLANSLGTVSPLYQIGGPRSMQFSLRFSF